MIKGLSIDVYFQVLKFMENSINLSVLLPIVPFGMAIAIFILLKSFSRTVNRLTKPVSFLILFSILLSTLLSSYLLINHVEGNISISNLLSAFNGSNLEIHLNELKEKIIIALGIITSLIILYSVNNLPRRDGYNMYIVTIGLFISLLISGILLIDIHL